MQLDIVRASQPRHVEGGFHWGPGRGRETPAKRNVKYKVKIQINRIERRQVGKAVEPLLVSFFDSIDERDNFVNR